MASGPCGVEFREAFSCFHYSKAEPKGSDCYDAFLTMQDCMSQYPQLYPPAKASLEPDELRQLTGAQEDLGLSQIKGIEESSEINTDAGSSNPES